MSYVKLFSEILTSTIWQEDDSTRLVWLTMLAMSDRYGEVMASVPGLAHAARVSVEHCEAAIKCLESPDVHSRTKAHDGRRIVAIDGGWTLLNHAKYRDKLNSEDRKEYNRRKQAEYREKVRLAKLAASDVSKNVTEMSANVTGSEQCQHSTAYSVQLSSSPEVSSPVPASPKPTPQGSTTPGLVETPLPFADTEFVTLWGEFEKHRGQQRKKLTAVARSRALAKLEAMGLDGAKKSIRQTLENGWQGLFEPKDDKSNTHQQKPWSRNTGTFNEGLEGRYADVGKP